MSLLKVPCEALVCISSTPVVVEFTHRIVDNSDVFYKYCQNWGL